VSDAERLAALDEEFAKYREETEAKHRLMRNVVNEIHKVVCTEKADCPVCKALNG